MRKRREGTKRESMKQGIMLRERHTQVIRSTITLGLVQSLLINMCLDKYEREKLREHRYHQCQERETN